MVKLFITLLFHVSKKTLDTLDRVNDICQHVKHVTCFVVLGSPVHPTLQYETSSSVLGTALRHKRVFFPVRQKVYDRDRSVSLVEKD